MKTEAQRRLTYALVVLDLCLVSYVLHVISNML